MAKIIRSNSPLALSVAAMTVPGDVRATTDRILEFDEARIGFTHADTWAAMPAARRGVIKSDSPHVAFAGTHARVETCIRALCKLGEEQPVETRRFADYPESGLRPISQIEWGPNVTIRVKGVCWYVKDGVPIIPLLQPRKSPLSESGMSLYVTLGRQAFCRDDWHNGIIELDDLSGDSKVASVTQIFDHELPSLSEGQLAQAVSTFIEAKAIVDGIRASRPKKPPKSKGDDLFDPKPPA
jgi:hypothetical protein